MTQEPKPLTEAEWQRISAPLGLTSTIDQIASALRERGLIAPELVDPLLIEARQQADKWWPDEGALTGSMDGSMWMERILAALRRGMELAERRTLTRGMVRDAHMQVYGYFGQDASIDRLHAALVERLK